MPTYEFKCLKCKALLTLNKSIHEELPKPICGHCKAEMMRVYSPTPTIYKTGGFYSTDKNETRR